MHENDNHLQRVRPPGKRRYGAPADEPHQNMEPCCARPSGPPHKTLAGVFGDARVQRNRLAAEALPPPALPLT